MRKKNSLKNMIATMGSNVVTILVGLIAQAIFIKVLGSEYLGLNSLFANIISMLGIAEMGIGSAIIYNLYKPIADDDQEKIKSLMQFYKKSYRIVGLIVMVIGLIMLLFIPYIIDLNSVTVNINVYYVYLLFLFDIILSYFLSYKRSILYANQKNYIINIIHIGYTILMNTLQILILILTHNFYLYLIIKVIMRFVENIIITLIANKLYPFIVERNVKKLDKKTEKDIFTKVKALFLHKIGTFIIYGTDNIIISKYLGLIAVGLYSNYYLIINAVQTVFSQVIGSTTASVGNLLVTETIDKQYKVFKRLRFFNFWIATFSAISVLVIMESFVKIWIGEKYLLETIVLIVLSFNLFQKLMRSSYSTFKEAAGIYYEDRFVPIIESTLNIIISILLAKKIGLAGVFIGTILSGLVLWLYSYPKYVYKSLFKRSYKQYFSETFGYIFTFCLIAAGTYILSTMLVFDNQWINFFSHCVLALTVPNMILFLIYNRTDNFKYYVNAILQKKSKTK